MILLFAALLAASSAAPVCAQVITEQQTSHPANGVTYNFTRYKKPHWAVHTLTVDLSRDELSLRIGKGLEHISGLERVHSIAHRFDSVNAHARCVAGINANFWQAGSNHPIGPTVIEGAILIGDKHRNWSAVAITENEDIFFNNFTLLASLRTRFGSIPIAHFNGRHDSTSLVLYNQYYGSSVPFVDTAWIFRASADTITDDSEADSAFTAVMDSTWSISKESGTLKMQFEYLRPPLANTIVPCRITGIDTGFVLVPRNGGVISFGKGQFPLFFSLFVGDTFSVDTRLDPLVPAPVTFMASGTPRLVRNGAISVEWVEEGLRKKRFVTNGYARSAFGLSRDGKKAIIVVVEPPYRRQRRTGIPLEALAKLLVDRGAWNAMNFDGGSSATMVVEGNTLSPPGGSRSSRKISTALMVVEHTR